MILNLLGIFGWKEADENLVLASLLTGDPLLLIGNHGCAKTHVANKVAQALGRRFLVYDASKAMFEDVLGYPNVEKLKHGVVEYVPSPVTIWDKELVLIDELNRAVPELQSKWLEIIRSRKIMGFPTQGGTASFRHLIAELVSLRTVPLLRLTDYWEPSRWVGVGGHEPHQPQRHPGAGQRAHRAFRYLPVPAGCPSDGRGGPDQSGDTHQWRRCAKPVRMDRRRGLYQAYRSVRRQTATPD